MERKKILAIASAGGHWVQLLRLRPSFDGNDVVYVSTKESFSEMVKDHEFFVVPDANRWNKLGLISLAFKVFRLVFKLKPTVIITTGAAPGLMAIISGRILGVKTIWVDSIANIDKISMSGRISIYFANKVYTQWPELENSKIMFKGNVIS